MEWIDNVALALAFILGAWFVGSNLLRPAWRRRLREKWRNQRLSDWVEIEPQRCRREDS